jgi:predicted nucleic acid-binding protein
LKLVVDTNVVLKALIRASKVRGILLSPNHQFYVPEYAIEEIERHLPLVMKKSGLHESEVKLVLSVLLTNLQVVPQDCVSKEWKEAERTMAGIDEGDVAFVAAALALRPDGIWSDDKHFQRQSKVKVWTTAELIKLT